MTDSKTTPDNANVEPAAEAQGAVGQLLRDTREKAGLDIADVARVLRISQKYLEALEDGRNADLPGAAYAIGFVRSYAEHLHLDGEEIVRRYKVQAEGVDAKTNLVFPKPIPDSGVPGAAVLGLGVIVAAVAYGVWYYNSQQVDVVADRVEAVPEHMAAADNGAGAPSMPPAAQTAAEDAAEAPERTPSVPEPTEPPAAEEAAAPEAVTEPVTQAAEAVQEDMAAAQTETGTAVDTAQETVTETVAADAGTATEETVQTAETPVTEAPAVPAQGAAEPTESATDEVATGEQTAAAEPATPVAEVAPDGPSRITVRAKSNSWIQVRDETLDRLLFTRLLREGDEYEVPNRPGLHLMTGNAGALELVVDGEVIPAIGDVGEVRRDVELDPEKLKSGTAVAE